MTDKGHGSSGWVSANQDKPPETPVPVTKAEPPSVLAIQATFQASDPRHLSRWGGGGPAGAGGEGCRPVPKSIALERLANAAARAFLSNLRGGCQGHVAVEEDRV